MKNISKERYIERKSKGLNGLWVFVVDGCGACESLKANIKLFFGDTFEYNLVNCAEDAKFYVSEGFDSMPVTVYYVEGISVFSREGVLYPTQLKKLKQMMESL